MKCPQANILVTGQTFFPSDLQNENWPTQVDIEFLYEML